MSRVDDLQAAWDTIDEDCSEAWAPIVTAIPDLLAVVRALENLCSRIEEGDWEAARAALASFEEGK